MGSTLQRKRRVWLGVSSIFEPAHIQPVLEVQVDGREYVEVLAVEVTVWHLIVAR